jgi:hypothetical protein
LVVTAKATVELEDARWVIHPAIGELYPQRVEGPQVVAPVNVMSVRRVDSTTVRGAFAIGGILVGIAATVVAGWEFALISVGFVLAFMFIHWMGADYGSWFGVGGGDGGGQ